MTVHWCWGLLCCTIATSVSADGLFSLKVENDLFSIGGDGHYTSGISGVWTFQPPDGHWSRGFADVLPGWSASSLDGVAYRFGQQMYTPRDIEMETLIKDDRPYAGLLLGGVSLVKGSQHDGWRRRDSLRVDVGIVGPASGAEAVQRNFHKLIAADKPRGWDHQLHNEPIVNFGYERGWIIQQYPAGAGLEVEYGPSAGVALGNLYTYASGGLELRFGDGLARSFGIHSIPPARDGGRSSFQSDQGFSWYLFTAVEGRYMAHNLLLDGNTFEDSHAVDRREWVGDAQVGAALAWDRWQVAYTYLWRSREFEEQDRFDHFGSIVLSTGF